MVDTTVRTVKLKLVVLGDETEKKVSWKRLKQICSDAWRAANWISAGQYMNDTMMRRLYARKKIDPKNREEIGKVEAEFTEFFGTKRQATTERDLQREWPHLPSCVTNALNQIVVSSYGKEKSDMLAGNRSLRTYRRGMPVPTHARSLLFVEDGAYHNVLWQLGRSREVLRFGVFYGRDKGGNRATIKRIIDGQTQYGCSSIQLSDNGLFLLLSVREPLKQVALDPKIAVGVDLGVSVPAYVALSEGSARMPIGFRDDFLRVRTQMQSRTRRLQRMTKSAHGGHGRKRKTRALERVRDKERNFVRQYNHFIAKNIVDFAVRNRAATIKLEMLEGFGDERPNGDFILRNWSYFEAQTLVKEKAAKMGIAVVFIDPYHTSQTCSTCGHYEPGQRQTQAKFKCAKCGEELNADCNAAVNIARSNRTVTSKEQCEYWKSHGRKVTSESERLGPQPKGEDFASLTN